MRRFTRLCVFLFLLFFTKNVFSQDSSAVKFNYNSQRVNDSEVVISIKGKINPGIRLFALQQSPGDVLYSSIQFDSSVKRLLKKSPLNAIAVS
jgi:hypothetical protein